MDNSKSDFKTLLVELESSKSKESIYKMKESNYIRDKEILEDSIKKFQDELQDKSELIRSLRRDLNSQSSNLFKELEVKNYELEKVIIETEDLKKKNIIYQETVDHHIQRIENLKSDMDKQKKVFEREIDCKTKLAGFYESSSLQKENKISLLTEENDKFRVNICDLQNKLDQQDTNIQQMTLKYEESTRLWQIEKAEKDQEIHRIKNEIIQLQQNGISELHLEKMNPIAAATLKVLKSSRGLMEIYSELHSKISEVDQLQMEKERLRRNKESLETELEQTRAHVERLNSESDELKTTSEVLKSRLLSLVAELRSCESKKSDSNRQLLVARKNLESSNQEIQRLNEQVRLFIVTAENGSYIKQEAVDTDSGLYTSVQELQEVNRSLRIDNEQLKVQLELSDSEQFKQRCEELQSQCDTLTNELNQLRQENNSNRSQSILHEKQVKLLRYLIELKAPGTSMAIENGLKRLESDNVVCVDCEYEPELESFDNSSQGHTKQEVCDQSFQQLELDSALDELMDNKRASDEVYVSSIEQMRTQLMDFSHRCNQLQTKWENCNEKLKEETEISEKYHQECLLLRSLNKNLSSNTANLESHIEDLKLKLAGKITLLAERKAEIDSCKNMVDMKKSELVRLRIERDELMKTVDIQEQIMANFTSLQSGVGLADHFYRNQTQNKIDNLEKLVEERSMEIRDKEEHISLLTAQLEQSRALEAVASNLVLVDVECQTDLPTIEVTTDVSTTTTTTGSDVDVVPDNSALMNSMAKVNELQQQLTDEKVISDQLVSQLRSDIEKHEIEITDLTQKCEFFETQIGLQEKARQEILSENIKLTEEAHNLNASLKLNLSNCQEELVNLKIRLEEAENVERTVQTVIDKYVKESNEAKAKYKRELTLHAADSKLLDAANKEIERLLSHDRSVDEQCAKLRSDLVVLENSYKQQIDDAERLCRELESKLHECECRNEKLYEQLQEISSQDASWSYVEIIEDLRNQIKIGKMSASLSIVQIERYENEIQRLREDLEDMKNQSSIEADRLNKSQCDENASAVIESEVIRESNHVLRQQKEQLERSLICQASELEELTDQVEKLKSCVAEANDEKNVLLQHRTDLEEEKNRWKDRCTKLVERAEQMDPEQYRMACNDRDRLKKLVQELEQRLQESRQCLDVANSTEADLQSKVEEMKEKLISEENKVKELLVSEGDVKYKLEDARIEVENVRSQLNEETNKLRREEGIVSQLREIGRKYKSESDKRRLLILELDKQIAASNEKLNSIVLENGQLSSKLEETETKLNLKKNLLSELKSRCDCLEMVNKDNANKILMKDEIIAKLKESSSTISVSSPPNVLKRSHSQESSGVEIKRTKIDQDDVSSNEDKCDESVDEEQEDVMNDINEDDDEEEEELGNTIDQAPANQEEMPEITEMGTADSENESEEIEEDVEDDDDEEEDELENCDPENDTNKDLVVEEADELENCDPENDTNEDLVVEEADESFHALSATNDEKEEKNDKEKEVAMDDEMSDIEGEVLEKATNDSENEFDDQFQNEYDETAEKPKIDTDEKEIRDNDEMEEGEVDVEEDNDDDEEEIEDDIMENDQDEDDDDDDASVILLDSSDGGGEEGGKDSTNCDDNDEEEDEYNSLVSAIELSLENSDENKTTKLNCGEGGEEVTEQNIEQHVDVEVSSSVDQSWNDKLIEMVSSSMLPAESYKISTESVPRLATRGRLRRPLRRPNPTD